MSTSSKTVPTKSTQKPAAGNQACHGSSRADDAGLQSESGQPSGILDPLQDAIFIFTADLHGIITGGNQREDNPGQERYEFAPADLVGRNIADLCDLGTPIASLLEKGRFESRLRWRTKSSRVVDIQLCLALLRDSKAVPVALSLIHI